MRPLLVYRRKSTLLISDIYYSGITTWLFIHPRKKKKMLSHSPYFPKSRKICPPKTKHSKESDSIPSQETARHMEQSAGTTACPGLFVPWGHKCTCQMKIAMTTTEPDGSVCFLHDTNNSVMKAIWLHQWPALKYCFTLPR